MSYYWNDDRKRWHWQFKAKIDGRVHRFSKLLPSGWSETQARKYDQQETARTYSRLSTGRPVGSTIDEAVSLYLRERAPALRDGKKAAQNLVHLLRYFSGKTLDQLGVIARDYARDNRGKLAPATIRQRLATLRSAANYARKHHQIGSSEFTASMPMPAVNNERQVFLPRRDIVLLARACHDFGTRALILLTFATGSRPGECHRAEPQDGALLMPETKNGRRALKPIPQRLQRYLRHWPMKYGYTYHAKRWRAARKALGMEFVHQHDLRHSLAGELIGRGASLAQVGEVLTHSSAQSTKRYAHLAQEDQRRLLEEIWQKKPNKRTA